MTYPVSQFCAVRDPKRHSVQEVSASPEWNPFSLSISIPSLQSIALSSRVNLATMPVAADQRRGILKVLMISLLLDLVCLLGFNIANSVLMLT